MEAHEAGRGRVPSSPASARRGGAGEESVEAAGYARSIAMGDMHLAADGFAAALESFERALAALGDHPRWRRERAEAKLRISECHRRRGDYHEGLRSLESIRREIDPNIDVDLAAKVTGRTGIIQQSLGDYLLARRNCLEAYEALRSGSDNQEIGLLELTLGAIASRLGEVESAREYFESALFTFRRIDFQEGIARALNNLGLVLTPTPRWKEALDYLERALAVSEQAGNAPRIASHCLNLGLLLTKRCEWAHASQVLSRALLTFREVDNSSGVTKALLALGNLKLRIGQTRVAAGHYEQALEIARRQGYRREEVLALEFLGEMELRDGRLAEARGHLFDALRRAESVAPEGDLVAEVKRRLAEESLRRGDTAAATRWATEAAWVAGRIVDHCEQGICLRLMGEAAWESGRLEEAIDLLRKSVALLAETPAAIEEIEARLRLAGALVFIAGTPGGNGAAGSAIEILDPVWDRIVRMDLHGLIPEYAETLARSLVASGDLEGALRTLDRALSQMETHGRTDQRAKLIALRIQLVENQAEWVLGTTEEFQILQEFAQPESHALGGLDGLTRLLDQMGRHLQLARALLATGPNLARLKVDATLGVDRPAAMLRALDPITQALAAGRKVWLAGNGGSRDEGIVAARWRQEGPIVAARLKPAEDLWGMLVAERGAEGEPFTARDLRLFSLFGTLLSVAIESRLATQSREPAAVEADPDGDPFVDFKTVDPATRQQLLLLRRVSKSDATILITGETGTGKGHLAQCIHNASRRTSGPFIQVNCAALPEQLLESELFGYMQGAFTGAVKNKRGLIEEADGGTLFLDEVDRCHRSVQAKLLHVLDRKEFRPVGDVRSRSVDVRIICATNTDLATAIRSGDFLEDLYYRLNDFRVSIPPLRDRREDIAILVRHFLERFTKESGRRPAGITRDALRRMMDHEWRGNVREVEKCIRRAVVLCEDGEWITSDLLPPEVAGEVADPSRGRTLREAVGRLEAELIRRTLDETNWNKSETSRRLRLSYPALLDKIRRYDLHPPQTRKNR